MKKLLGMTFDCKLRFNKHIKDICQKASHKLNALARLAPVGITKKRILMNAFFKSQFNYCTLVWVCCNRSLNTLINRLHERCLRVVYNDKKSNFNELISKVALSLSIIKIYKNWQLTRLKFKVSKVPKLLMNCFNLESKYLMN